MHPPDPPPAAPSAPPPAARARREAAAATERADVHEARLAVNGRWRIAAFLLLAGPLLLLETSPRSAWPPLLGAAAIGGVLFLHLVRRHGRIRALRDRERLRARINEELLARLERRWADAPRPDLPTGGPDHPYAKDLDVIGRGSLAQLLGRTNTAPGRAALARALLDPLAPFPARAVDLLGDGPDEGDHPGPNPDAREDGDGVPGPAPPVASHPPAGWHEGVRRRQAAVKVLAREPELLEALELAGREVAGRASTSRTAAFLVWASGGLGPPPRGWLLHAARAVTAFNLATLVGWFAGWIAPPLWILGFAGAFLLNRTAEEEAHLRFSAAEGGEDDPARWAGLLEVARRLPGDDPVLARIREPGMRPEPGAAGALQRLRRITDFAAARRSGLAHFFLAAAFAWDVHLVHRLEGWRSSFGHAAEEWVLAVAELELLLALAGLRHEHPPWCFPSFRLEQGAGIRGKDVGHPLLVPSGCVGNDVELPPPGRLLLVTGSNMAGKTTLLRALGANQVLALAGGPVAAAAFETRPILPWTAMRVSDSLTEGVSFFMAELRRLKRVVEAARDGPVLFLLDEILQGTNTAERRTAARIVLRHLLATDAVGSVTTHDLTLADAPDLAERSVDVHFREEVIEDEAGRRLHFDYRLRPGPATSRNALLLLEMVGLGEEGGAPADPDGDPTATGGEGRREGG